MGFSLARLRMGLFIGLGAATLALLAGAIPFLRTVELKTYDWRLRRTADPSSARSDVVLVEINETTLRELEPLAGRWPWPRVVHASLIEFLARAPARVVAYDILFTERDRRVGFEYGDGIWSGRESDDALVASVANAGNVILLADATYEGVETAAAAHADATPAAEAVPTVLPNPGYRLDEAIEDRPVLTPPFPELARAARALAHNIVVVDPDGPVRRVVPFIRNGDWYLPALGVAAAVVAEGLAPADVAIQSGQLRLGPHRPPTVTETLPAFAGDPERRRARRALINFRGPAVLDDGRTRPYQTYSFLDLLYAEEQILAGEPPHIDPAVFRDKIVFVGVTAVGLFDVFAVPFAAGGRMPGIQIHANVVDDLLSDRFLHPASGTARLVAVAGSGLAVGVAATLLPVTAGVFAALGLALTVVWVAVELFERGLWLPLTEPLLAMAMAAFAGVAHQYFIEGREKRKIRRLFGRYVPRDVCDQLIANPSLAELGGRRRDMSVLFSDIRGFTTLSEKGQPEEVVTQLNEYFSRMVDVLFRHRGTLDKFVGDMVMALFGAPVADPHHADRAVQAALDMVHELGELNRAWVASGRAPLDIGIGINTGEMIAGNIGSSSIMSYTVIGDAVNLGARLESLNKEYGTRIIISGMTRRRLTQSYDLRPLGSVTVRGKSEPVVIFEVRTEPGAPPPGKPA